MSRCGQRGPQLEVLMICPANRKKRAHNVRPYEALDDGAVINDRAGG